MPLPNSSAWGASPWGSFMWGSAGKTGLAYPPEAPTTTLPLRAIRPYHRPIRKMQPMDLSNAGDPYIYNKGLTGYEFSLSLKLSLTEANALRDLFDVSANGRLNQVLYIDPYGARHIVRIMMDRLDIVEEAYHKHTVTLDLKKEG